LVTILQRAAEFIFVYFFQSVLFVYGIHFFSKHPIKWKPFFLCAGASMVATYIARILLTFGNHTIFSLIILILLSIFILKIPTQAVVKSALLITIIIFIFEGVNFLSLKTILGNARFNELIQDDFQKRMAGLPSNVLLTAFLAAAYFIRKKRNKHKGE